MLKRKRLSQRGKISFTKYFQIFNSGDSVSLVKEMSLQKPGFPNRMQGRTGKIIRKRGSAYEVEIKDYDMKKTFIVKPINLKRVD